jgi:hypothetical protein
MWKATEIVAATIDSTYEVAEICPLFSPAYYDARAE